MQRKLVPMIVAASAAIASAMLALAETTIVDDLHGLRPNTQGVQTNAFWDTRLHGTYTIKSSSGASTNALDTSVMTVAASNGGDIGVAKGMIIIFR